MDEKKKVSLAVVILNCACAVLWWINLIRNLAFGHMDSGTFLTQFICAIVWSICAVIWLKRYTDSKAEDRE